MKSSQSRIVLNKSAPDIAIIINNLSCCLFNYFPLVEKAKIPYLLNTWVHNLAI